MSSKGERRDRPRVMATAQPGGQKGEEARRFGQVGRGSGRVWTLGPASAAWRQKADLQILLRPVMITA